MAQVLKNKDFDQLRFTFDGHVDAVIKNRQDLVMADRRPTCKFYQKGTCMKGKNCIYRHSRGEKTQVCKHWLRGLCKKNDDCEFLHVYDLSKMPPCHFFQEYGDCSNPECLFLHIRPEDRVKDCPWYAKGFCRHGPNCRNRHIQKEACADYLAGFCILGPVCSKAHPKFEDSGEDVAASMDSLAKVVPNKCTTCGSNDHLAGNCPSDPNNQGTRKKNLRSLTTVQCFKCGDMGHYANMCPNQRKEAPQGGYSLPGRPDVRVSDPRNRGGYT